MKKTKLRHSRKTKASHKRVGRPRKNKKTKTPEVDIQASNVKTHRFAGFCHCGLMITKTDFESELIFICPNCGKRQKKNQLKQESNLEKHSNKKEYLENTINAKHIDMPTMNDDVPPEILKKYQEED